MSRRTNGPPRPPRTAKPKTLTTRTTHTTVPAQRVPQQKKPPLRAPKLSRSQPRGTLVPRTSPPPSRQVARIMEDSEASLLDLIDNLLGKGVMLNADLILALANVDLIYVRLSALLCAADRIMPPPRPARP